MMKKLFILLVSVFLLSLSAQNSVFADSDESDNDSSTSVETTSEDEDARMEMKKMNKEKLSEMKKMNIEKIKDNKKEAEDNRKEFKMDNRNELKDVKSTLTEEEKTALETLRDTFESDMKALKEASKTATDKEAVYAEMKELADAHYEAMKTALSGNAEAVALLEEKQAIHDTNENLREENRDSRKEYRQERNETVQKYRDLFIAKLGNRLESIPNDKLAKVADTIDTLLLKYEENTTLTEEKKDTIMSQLVALKEIIEEKIEGDDLAEEVTGIVDELLSQ